MNCSIGASEISIAPPSTSPSPCTAWPSPVKNWAPLLNIGRYNVEPLARNFRSILPRSAELNRPAFDSSVPLYGVAVSREELGALVEYWKIQRRAFGEKL